MKIYWRYPYNLSSGVQRRQTDNDATAKEGITPPSSLFLSKYTANITMVPLLRWPSRSINESEPKARQIAERERSKLPAEEGYRPNCG